MKKRNGRPAMIELVAKAIHNRDELWTKYPSDVVPWDDATEGRREWSRAIARAAIEAMRKPNRKMLNAAAKAMSPEKRPTPTFVSTAAKHQIRYMAMIDVALGKPEEEEQATWDALIAPPSDDTPQTGFLATLTAEQQARALAYRGPDTFGCDSMAKADPDNPAA